MKKIISFFLIISIFSLNFSNLLPAVVYAQTSNNIDLKPYLLQCSQVIPEESAVDVDEDQLRECVTNLNLNITNFSSLKRCVGTAGVNNRCVSDNFGSIAGNKLTELIACLNDSLIDVGFVPMIVPEGRNKGWKFNFKEFLEILKNQIMQEVIGIGVKKIMDLVNSFLQGIFGSFLSTKVPTDDKTSQSLIGKSVEETIKNTFSQIQAGINLGLQDAHNYLAFKIRSTLEKAIYEKIFKNFIPDIQQYRYLRMYQAYARALDKILAPYIKDDKITCLPVEVKTCAFNLLDKAAQNAQVYIGRSETPRLTKRLFKSLQRTKRFAILNKPNCDPRDPNTFKIYSSLGLTPRIITAQQSGTLTSQILPTQSLIAKAEAQRPSLLAQTINLFSNPFRAINLRSLLGQTGGINTQNNLIDPTQIADNVISIANCNLIFDTSTAQIFKELESELSTFNAYINQPGATNFKPKTACLKTTIEDNIETLTKQKEQLIKEKGTTSAEVQNLEATIQTLKEKNEQLRKVGISGENPMCIQKGEIENPISTYENMREKITKGTLDFFENREGSTNVLVSYIRGWINSELFKLIDQGFSKIYKGKSDELFVQNNLEAAYSEQRRQEICGKIPEKDLYPLRTSCDSLFNLNKQALVNLTVFDLQSQLADIKNILTLITNLQNKINSYATTMASGTNAFTGYLAIFSTLGTNPPSSLREIYNSLQQNNQSLNNASLTLNDLVNNANNIFNFASNTLERLNTAFQQLENSTIAQEINNTQNEISRLQSQLASTTQKINNLLREINNKSNNPRIQSLYAQNIAVYSGFIKNGDPSGYIGRDNLTIIVNQNISQSYIFNNYIEEGRLVLGNQTKLSFYDYFYPNLIRELANNIVPAGRFYNDILKVKKLATSWWDDDDFYSSPPHIAAEVIRVILESLFKVPEAGVLPENQNYLLSAVNNRLGRIFSGDTNATITSSDINYLNNFFNNLYAISTVTLSYINNNQDIFKNNNGRMNFNLGLLIGNNIQAHEFNFQETLTLILGISQAAKELFEEIKKNNSALENQRRLNELNQRLNELQNEYNRQIERILIENGVNPDELRSKVQEAKNLESQIKDLEGEINNICNEYNDNLIQGEMAFNTYLRNQQALNNPPPDEESGGGGNTGQFNNSTGKRLAFIIKGFVANIFEPFNFLKPKRVQIK